ncbi:MAG: ATP-dependent helicase HrpB [Gemmatimonadaceae bacterium]|nr:ATP-dependent helicase HrpB [Gemmatimonadaceae bacterium]
MRASPHPALPIDPVLPELLAVLERGASAVLAAPPGAGKTTRVPLALLGARWLGGGRIVMLEPRRLAARAAARRMAAQLGESVGDTVGYRVRGDSRVGSNTRVEVVTEGVLSRAIVRDPSLHGVGAVIFDEYHERSLVADVGLALTLQTQELLRPELRVLVMSATLDGDAVASLLGGAPVVRSTGRAFPVTVRHVRPRDGARIEATVAAAIRRALADDPGSVLAFLPGAAEIRRTQDLLAASALASSVTVHPLFGDLAPAEQDAAIASATAGHRKVVLATSIAESSLTIDGVGIVVDSGLARVPRFTVRTGMTRLETVRISRPSADQRAGRAGRTAPGVCYRLWSEEEHASLSARATPEMLEADLASLALDLAAAGIDDPRALRWLDVPPSGAFSQARELLRTLGALDTRGRISPHGQAMSEVATHPRLAHLLLAGRERGLGSAAALVAALLDERDLFVGQPGERDVDLRVRVAIAAGRRGGASGPGVDRATLERVRDQARRWRAQLGVVEGAIDEDAAGLLLALAYPDRVGVRRKPGSDRFLLRNGAGAVLPEGSSLGRADWLVVAELDGRAPESRIRIAAPLERSELDDLFDDTLDVEDVIEWDATGGAIVAVRRERLGAIVLRERPLRELDEWRANAVLITAIRRADGLALPWTDNARRTRDRIAFIGSIDASWPDVSNDALLSTMEDWLASHLGGIRRREELEALDLGAILLEQLSWAQRRALDELAPTHVVVPTGSRVSVEYADPIAPYVAVRLQELFGLADGPRVGGGRVPLVLRLLSPAQRPVQITRDLAGFWATSYADVRRDLRGRYPRHAWPEDPAHAEPTRRARPRR